MNRVLDQRSISSSVSTTIGTDVDARYIELKDTQSPLPFNALREYTVACPNGDGGRTIKNGKQKGWQRYLCKTFGKQFRSVSLCLCLHRVQEGLPERPRRLPWLRRRYRLRSPVRATPERWRYSLPRAAVPSESSSVSTCQTLLRSWIAPLQCAGVWHGTKSA